MGVNKSRLKYFFQKHTTIIHQARYHLLSASLLL